MADKKKIKLTPLSPRRRATLLKLEKSLKEGAPSGSPLLGSGYQKSTEPLDGQNTDYAPQTIISQSSTEPLYKNKGVDYNAPTSD